jgi:hypothetical protein
MTTSQRKISCIYKLIWQVKLIRKFVAKIVMNQPVGKYIMIAGALIYCRANLVFLWQQTPWIKPSAGRCSVEKKISNFISDHHYDLISVVITVLIRLFSINFFERIITWCVNR